MKEPFPAEGIWVVTREGNSSSMIMPLCDLDVLNVPSIAAMSVHMDEVVKEVHERLEKESVSTYDLVKMVMVTIGKHHVDPDDFLSEMIANKL